MKNEMETTGDGKPCFACGESDHNQEVGIVVPGRSLGMSAVKDAVRLTVSICVNCLIDAAAEAKKVDGTVEACERLDHLVVTNWEEYR